MTISATTVFVGPSIYAQRPVVHFTLDATEQQLPAVIHQELLGDLLSRLPGLRRHTGSCGVQKFFSNSGPDAAIPLGHLFEHLCLELQNLAGAELSCVRVEGGAVRTAPAGAAVPYEEPEVCIEAARLAGDLIAGLLPGLKEAEFADRLREFVKFAAAAMLPVQDRALIRTARALDIPVRRLVGRTIALGDGRFQRRLSATKTSLTDVVSNDLAANKDYSRRVFGDLGLPVPRYERVHTGRDAVAAARRIGYPVVVKPNNGSMGSGVSVGMKNRREVSAAYKRARELSKSVLVEEVVEGSDYRMLVINGKLCAASQRVPGHVVGDGVQTIEELVAEVNRDPRRGTGPTSSWTRIELDLQADRLITSLGYTRQSVPGSAEVIYLRRNANTSDGGTAVDVTDAVHADNRAIAVRAARAIGLDIAGVDFLTTDISTSMWKNGGRICEINSRPGLRKHLWPAKGKPRDVITPIIDMLFPENRPSRIPVVAIVGGGNTGITARMLAHILTAAGHHVGLAVDHRVYSGGRRTRNIRQTPPAAARAILLDPDVDIAVLEMAPDDILRHGLGCDVVDVVAILNAGAGDEPASGNHIAALEVVAHAARKVVYVGDSTEWVAAVSRSCNVAEVCRVVRPVDGRPAPDRPATAGRQVVLEGDAIAIYNGERAQARIPFAEMLKRHAGVDGSSVAESVLYACVSALSLGKSPGEIYRSLSNFNPAPKRRESKKAKRKSNSGTPPEATALASGQPAKTLQDTVRSRSRVSGPSTATSRNGTAKGAGEGRLATRPVGKS